MDMCECVVCGVSLEGFPEQARNLHVNECLDQSLSKETDASLAHALQDEQILLEDVACYSCGMCGKDLSKYSVGRRQAHSERCCRRQEEEIETYQALLAADEEKQDLSTSRDAFQEEGAKGVRKSATRDASVSGSTSEASLHGKQYSCFLCGRKLDRNGFSGRVKHIKQCATARGLQVADVSRLRASPDPIASHGEDQCNTLQMSGLLPAKSVEPKNSSQPDAVLLHPADNVVKWADGIDGDVLTQPLPPTNLDVEVDLAGGTSSSIHALSGAGDSGGSKGGAWGLVSNTHSPSEAGGSNVLQSSVVKKGTPLYRRALEDLEHARRREFDALEAKYRNKKRRLEDSWMQLSQCCTATHDHDSCEGDSKGGLDRFVDLVRDVLADVTDHSLDMLVNGNGNASKRRRRGFPDRTDGESSTNPQSSKAPILPAVPSHSAAVADATLSGSPLSDYEKLGAVSQVSCASEDDPGPSQPKRKTGQRRGLNAILRRQLRDTISSSTELYQRMLAFEVMDFEDVYTTIIGTGLKCSRKALSEYLDEEGVVFRLPQKPSSQGARSYYHRA